MKQVSAGVGGEVVEFRHFGDLDRFLFSRPRIVRVEGRRFQIPPYVCPGTLYHVVIARRHALVDAPPARAYVEIRDGEEVLIRPVTAYVDESGPVMVVYSYLAPVPPEWAKKFRIRQHLQKFVCRKCGYVHEELAQPSVCCDCGSKRVVEGRGLCKCGEVLGRGQRLCARCVAAGRRERARAKRWRERGNGHGGTFDGKTPP